MLWCKWLPFLAPFLGCQKEVAVAPDVVAPDAVNIVDHFERFLEATQERLTPITITLSNCIPATPVVHTPPATPMYHPAAARPTVSSFDFDYESESAYGVPALFLSWHDVVDIYQEWIVVLAHAYEEGGFDVPSFRVSPHRVMVALYALFSLHLFCMICFGDYMLPFKVVLEIFRGFCAGSTYLWTLIGTGLLFFTYDTNQAHPFTVGLSEVLAVTVDHSGYISRFLRGKVISRKYFWHYSSIPRRLDTYWLMEEFGMTSKPRHPGVFWPAVMQFEHIRYMQKKGPFKPTTFAELALAILVFFYLRMVGAFDICCKVFSEIWRLIGPTVKAQYYAFPGCFTVLCEIVQIHKVPGFLLKTLPLGFWHLLVSIRGFFRLWYWSNIEANCGKPFETKVRDGVSLDMYNALDQLGTMSMVDMAEFILAHEELKFAVVQQEPRIRQRVEQEHSTTMTELAKRVKSWRVSHRELLTDYNHCRLTLSNVLRFNLCAMMDLDADAPENQNWFSPSLVVVSEEALPNGLHYKQCTGGTQLGGSIDDSRMVMNTQNFRKIIYNGSKGIRGPKYREMYLPRRIDIYNPKTWPLDLTLLGLRFASSTPDACPFDLDQRRPRPFASKELEDYVADGQLQQWFEDLHQRHQPNIFQQHRVNHLRRNGYWQRQ